MERSSLIIKYLKGEASSKEQQELYRRMAQDEGFRHEFEDTKLLFEAPGAGEMSVTDFYKDLRKIRTGIQQRIDQRHKRSSRRWQWALLVALVANITAWLFVQREVEDDDPLLFTSMPLQQVTDVLAARYQVVIELDHPSAGSCLFSGAFYNIDRGEDAVHSLARALNLESRQLPNGHYQLSGRGC